MFTRIKLALRLIKALGELTQEIRFLRETLVASTVLLNTKPISLSRTLDLDRGTVGSPLLFDLLSSYQDHQEIEITDYKDEVTLAKEAELATIEEARRKFAASREISKENKFRAWRE